MNHALLVQDRTKTIVHHAMVEHSLKQSFLKINVSN